jgi:hypothetical protein
MNRQLVAVLAIGASLVLTQPLLASQLLISRPSDVVDLDATLLSDGCTNPPGARTFDTRLLPDGTEEEFEIPPGQVLVVTAVEILGFGASSGANIQTRLFRTVGLQAHNAAIRESFASSSGRIFHIYEFSPGLVVASGGQVCTNSNDPGVTLTGRLRGFLKKDR